MNLFYNKKLLIQVQKEWLNFESLICNQRFPLKFVPLSSYTIIIIIILIDRKMNVLNYFRGKGSKVEVDSPIKKSKALSSSQEIYLQQIRNYIQAQGGYDVLKEKLFRDLNEHYMHDSPLVQEIVILLRKGLQTHERDKQLRAIIVIEDLLRNCSALMNEGFNDKKFCEALYQTALYFRNLKNSSRDQIRSRCCGIFLYWHQKFNDEPNYVYHQFYQRLRKENVEFPSLPFIKEVVPTNNKQTTNNTKSQLRGAPEIINDCEQVIITAQNLMKSDKSKINTTYVRLLKAKNKKLYELSTSQQFTLTSQQKQKASSIYKRIRTFLKEVEKINEANVQSNAIQKEKVYLQEKMTPKKSEQEIPKISLEPTAIRTKKSQQQRNISQKVGTPQKQDTESIPSNYNKDLLDIQPADIPALSSQKNKVISLQERSDQKMITPKKSSSVKESEELLDLSNDYSSPSSTKQINFKELYAQNQLSPELKDLDLTGGSGGKVTKGKQKLKNEDSDQGQFGEFR